MNPERWQQVKQVFQAVAEVAPAERSSLLTEACAGDAALRREVEALLRADEQAADFIEESAYEVAAKALAEEEAESAAGRQVGPYKLVRALGRGGMGAVYLAERDDAEYRKRVALKLIKRGMDTEAVLRRFRHERQILAQLEHPHIARLLDGGTTADGLPYFVMEYVEGQPITEYAEAHKLSVTERLKLFRAVCAAVAYAHQNLVIHRDLKPSNILVTTEGVPKLLDFGIAKLLHIDPASQTEALTATELRVMTPEYASPEQVRGEAVTTLSDVYSLGIVLYELLTGQRPYRFPSRRPDEMARIICEQEPYKPSTAVNDIPESPRSEGEDSTTRPLARVSAPGGGDRGRLRRRLRGDLDNIVLMALRKETARRYASVEQLAEDLRRHMEGLPVKARRATFAYCAAKFTRRHRVSLVAAALVALALVVGIIATSWQARVARRERARAESHFNDVRQLANSFIFEVNDELERGVTRARELLVRRAVEYLDSLTEESEDASLLHELALAYRKVGDVQSQLHRPNVGDSSGARASYQKSVAILEQLHAAAPDDAPVALDLATGQHRLGDIMDKLGDTTAALAHHRHALAIVESIAERAPDDAAARAELSRSLLQLGRSFLKSGDLAGAQANFQRAQELQEALLAENPTDMNQQRRLMSIYHSSGYARSLLGDWAGALDFHLRGLTMAEARAAAEPANVAFRRDLQVFSLWAASAYGDAGRIDECVLHQERAFAIAQELLAADPTNMQARNNLADALLHRASTLVVIGRAGAALADYRQAIAHYEAVWAADPRNAHARRQVWLTQQQLGDAQAALGNTASALETYRRTLDVFQELMTRDPANAEFQYDLALSHRKAGEMLLRLGDPADALDHLHRAVTLLEALPTQSPLNTSRQRDLALAYFATGQAQERLAAPERRAGGGRSEQRRAACDWYGRSAGLWQDLTERGAVRPIDVAQPQTSARALARCVAALR